MLSAIKRLHNLLANKHLLSLICWRNIFSILLAAVLSVACQPASKKAQKSAAANEDPLPIAGEDFDFIQPGEEKTLDASRAKVYFVAETLNQAVYAAIVVNKESLTHSPNDERGNISLVMQTEDGSQASDIVLNEGLKIMIKAFDLTNLEGVRVVVLDDEDEIIDTITNNKLTIDKNSKGIFEVSFSTFYTNATFVLIEPAALDPRFYVNQAELELLAEQQALEDFRTLSFEQRYAKELSITVNLEAKSSTFKEFHFGEGEDCAEFTLQTETVQEFSYALSPTEGLKTLCLLLRNSWGDEASSTQTIFYDEFVPESLIEIAAILGPESTAGVNTSLSGSASDTEAGSGIEQVLVTLQDAAGACLNQTKTAFDQICPIWLTATGKEAWELAVPDTLFIHEETYTLSAKAYDKAGREQTTAGTSNFVWDGSAPQSLFVINNDDDFTSDVNVVLSLVDDADVSQYRVGLGEDCSTAEWEEYSSPLIYALENVDGEKILCLQTRDAVLNQSEVSLDTIVLDTELPTSEADLLSDIGPTTTAGVNTIFAGVAEDLGSGVVSVEASIERNGQCLNSALSNFNQACPHWIVVTGTETWTLEVLDALFTNNQTYVLRTRASDGIGNIQSPVFTESFSWRESGPNPSFNLNSGASFSSSPVLDVIFQNSTGIAYYRKQEIADCGAVTWNDNDWNIFSGNLTHIIDGGDGAIRVCLQVKDSLDNLSSVSFDDITYDTQEGSSSITTNGAMGPSTEAGANSSISGTASDVTSGVATVHVSLQQGAGSCLNAGKTAFNAACPQWHIAGGTVNWSFSVADNLLVDGTTYNISSRVTDNANNVEATFGSSSFTWDTSAPNAGFLINNNDQYTNSIVVDLDITDDSDIEIYGADLLGCATAANIAYAGGGAIANFALTGADGTKTVCLKVLDAVSNSAQSTDTIILDTTLPDSVINMSGYIGPDSTAGANTVLAGVSSDATSGIAEVYVSLQFNNNFCLNSAKTAFNAACPEWHVASGTTTWSLTLADTLFSDGAYSMQSRAVDNAGNIETTYGTASFSWLVGAPNANFTINGGNLYTDTAAVTLDLVDDTAVTEYFAEEGNCAAPVYQNYAGSGSISYNLSGGDGDKTVCLILKNAATYESNIVYQSIMLDSTAPASAITTTTEIGPNTTAGATTFIEGTASDASSGVAQVRVSLQNDGTGLYLNSAKTNFNAATVVWHTAIGDNDWYLSVSDSLFVAADYNIEVVAVDNASNEQALATALTVTWDEVAPSAEFVINSDSTATHLTAVQLDLNDDSGIAEYIAEQGDCSSTSFTAYGGGGAIAFNLSAGSSLKTVCLKVRDVAGNVSSVDTDSIQLDQVEPNSAIEAIGVGGYFGPNTTAGINTTFSGTATDNLSGLDEVYISVQEGAGFCLDQTKTAFSENCPEWILATGTDTWSFSVADAEFAEGETYTIRTKAVDVATVEETTFASLAVQWLSATPSAEFTVNNDDAATASAAVNLVLNDDSGITEYFAEVGACGSPVFVAYAGGGSIAFNLSAGQGLKSVCLIVRDAVGNVSAIDTDTIIFDSVDPGISITVAQNMDVDTTAGVNTSFAGTASDVGGSGLDSVEVQIKRFSDGSCLNTAKSAFNETCPHYIVATGTDNWSLDVADALFADGKYELTARATDIAANEISASQIQFWFSEDNQLRFIDIAIGEKHACGLGIHGQAYCWGQNTNGQLGVDTATEVALNGYAYRPQYAVNVPASEKFISITAGSLHSCGLNQDGKIFCWGSNSHGQIGNNGVGVGNDQETALQISLGEAPSAYFLQVKAAGQHSCALHINGKVYCWGRGDSGEIGDGGTTLNNATPVETSLPGAELFINLTVGQNQNCAMSNNTQKFYCWGRDTDGEVGDGTPDDANNILEEPIAVDLSVSPNAKMIQAAGSRYATCSLSAAGQLFCFGNDAQGAVGDGAGDSGIVKSAAVVVPETAGKRFIELAAGLDHFCALSSDAKIWCWGDNSKNQAGKDVGVETDVFQPKLVDGQDGLLFQKIAAGGLTTCGIAQNGAVYCLGSDDFGQRGDAGIADSVSESPIAIDASLLASSSAFVQMASGRTHQCALSGAGHIYCWGRDDSGQLGNGSSQSGDQEAPILVEANMSDSGSPIHFRYVAAAGDYSCALATSNRAYCWGDNTYGQLGNGLVGAGQKAEYPTAVGGNLEFRSLSLGLYHVCGLRADDGSIYCWGKGDTGAIGDGNYTNRTAPTLVSGAYSYIDVAAGNGFSCGVRDNLDAYCWGSDYYRTLGDGATDSSGNVPASVVTTAASGFVNLTAVNNHVCGLTADQTVECWGRGNRGQLGNNQQTIKSESTPTTYAGNGVRSLSAGEEHTCLSAVDGRLHCFGASDNYVSNGVQSSDVVNPFDFYGFDVNIINAKQASAGQGNTCFLNGQGQIYCIGRDSSGEKGDGSNLDSGEFDALDLSSQLWY